MTDTEPRTTTTEIEMAGPDQGIVVFDGSGLPLILTDLMQPQEVAEYLTEPVARRVLIARLRIWADVIESIDEAAAKAQR